MIRKIHVFASLGNRKKLPAGGGQTSARRLVKVLENQKYNVSVVNRTVTAYTSESLYSKFYKCYGYLVDPIRWFFHLLLGKKKDSAILVIGYSGSLFPYYFLFVRIGKLLGYKTVVYIKGGFTTEKYNRLKQFSKNSYITGLEKTDVALYEGEEGATISMNVQPDTKAVWIPNYVENGFAPHCFPSKSEDSINLLYFGRIHYNKNILLIIDIFDKLCDKFSNMNLTIIGSGLRNYELEIEKRIKKSPNKDRIKRLARVSHDDLKTIIDSQHIFVFPSVEAQEGHSNALNEAMSFGVVPVVSNNNFLPSIVGNKRLVIDEMTVDEFVRVIEDVIESGDYDKLSREMYERVQQEFTQSVVEKKLKETLDRVFSGSWVRNDN